MWTTFAALTFAATLATTLAATASAQIRDLATNHDGSVLHFATDLRLSGMHDGGQGKIYAYQDGKFSVILSPATNPVGFRTVSLLGPVLSGDAKVTGYGTTLPDWLRRIPGEWQ
jgi:hypothetical protein